MIIIINIFIIVNILAALILLVKLSECWVMIKLWEMYNNLVEWIDFGIGDDIVRSREHRPEFKYYVEIVEKDKFKATNIPFNVAIEIKKDLKGNILFKSIYFNLIWLKLRKKI